MKKFEFLDCSIETSDDFPNWLGVIITLLLCLIAYTIMSLGVWGIGELTVLIFKYENVNIQFIHGVYGTIAYLTLRLLLSHYQTRKGEII